MEAAQMFYCALLFVAFSADADVALQTASAAAERQEQAVSAWRVVYSVSVTGNSSRTPGATGRQQSIFQELRKGDLYRTTRTTETEVSKGLPSLKDELENAFDGSEFRSYSAKENAGGLSTESGVDHSFTGYLYGVGIGGNGVMTLVQLLHQARTRGSAEWVQIKGDRLLKCVYDKGPTYENSLYLDPAHSWQPERRVADMDLPPGSFPDGRKHQTLVWTASAYVEKDGVTLPSNIRFTDEYVTATGQTVRESERKLVVRSLEINPAVDDAAFRIVFPEGTRVKDRDREVVYIQGKPGSERSHPAVSPEDLRPALSMTGEQRTLWSDFRIWLGLSALFLIAIAFASWRQRAGSAS